MKGPPNAPVRWRLSTGVVFFLIAVAIAGWMTTASLVSRADPTEAVIVVQDIPYAEISGFDSKLTSLDIYQPSEGKGLPVLIFIHGGAWKTGDKRFHRDIGEFFAQNGYVTVCINYRLAPDAIHPAQVADVAAAVRWVFLHIAEYNGNPERVFVMGHSAGAHLAALVATDERYLRAYGLNLGTLAGVVPLDGAGFDVTELMTVNERVYGRMFRTAFGNDPNNWADGSPISHIEKGKSIPPFLVIWAGSRDEARPQTQRFAAALEGAGVVVETYHAKNRTHMSILTEIGKDGDEATRRILGFLKRHGS